jgi:hypothetical protein
MTKRTLFAVAALVWCSLAGPAAASKPFSTRASASFQVDHGNQCTVTTATIEVAGNPDAVTFHWDVFGQPLDPGCDGLWYYFLDGEAPLNPGEFSVEPNHRSATLEKVISVLDDESGTTFDVLVIVQWTRLPRQGVVAEMRISAPQIGTQWTSAPLESATATLRRLRR